MITQLIAPLIAHAGELALALSALIAAFLCGLRAGASTIDRPANKRDGVQ